ncbi:hypothetical protein AB0L40_26030 [Patulibacter sp. NPDC049589]|uniref:hypothetical protein n=1 Tax=Patulibacter sp. NPDC049589 TaxID=3154731 RepID=UPI003434AD21
MIAATFTHHARDLLHLVPPAALRALHREAIRAGEAAARVHRRLADEMHGSRTRMRRIGDRYFQPLTDAGEAWVRTVEALTAAAVR